MIKARLCRCAARLVGHQVVTAYEASWSTLRNGQLVAEREAFDLLITTDQHLRYQQNLAARRIAVLVIGSTAWPRIQQHPDRIRTAVEQITSGKYREVSIS